MAKSLRGVRVLVVEDDPDLGTMTRIFLEDEGAMVRVVKSGGDALRQVGSFAPELALLDSRLPDMPGRTLSGLLHEHAASCVQVLVSGDHAEVANWSRFGGHAVSKPYDLDEFLGVLVRAIHEEQPAAAASGL